MGHKALRELSSIAWYNAYSDRGMDRVPTLKSELKEVIEKYKGHVIATTACMGGELSTLAYEMETSKDVSLIEESYLKIKQFLIEQQIINEKGEILLRKRKISKIFC